MTDLFLLIASRLLRIAFSSEKLSATAQRRIDKILFILTERIRADICTSVLDADIGTVRAGPFAGMRIKRSEAWGSDDLLPKVLGTYELELLPTLQRLQRQSFDIVLNIGAADGYYAVGAAMTIPAERYIAVDIDPAAKTALYDNARLNSVADKIEFHPRIDAQKLEDIVAPSKQCLILSDCEGYELDLFGKGDLAHLQNCFLVIECHDVKGESTCIALSKIFPNTHKIEIIHECGRDPHSIEALEVLNSQKKWLAVCEHRNQSQSWLLASPK